MRSWSSMHWGLVIHIIKSDGLLDRMPFQNLENDQVLFVCLKQFHHLKDGKCSCGYYWWWLVRLPFFSEFWSFHLRVSLSSANCQTLLVVGDDNFVSTAYICTMFLLCFRSEAQWSIHQNIVLIPQSAWDWKLHVVHLTICSLHFMGQRWSLLT